MCAYPWASLLVNSSITSSHQYPKLFSLCGIDAKRYLASGSTNYNYLDLITDSCQPSSDRSFLQILRHIQCGVFPCCDMSKLEVCSFLNHDVSAAAALAAWWSITFTTKIKLKQKWINNYLAMLFLFELKPTFSLVKWKGRVHKIDLAKRSTATWEKIYLCVASKVVPTRGSASGVAREHP